MQPKKPLRVSTEPGLSIGVLVFGFVAILAAAGALVRHYVRARHSPPVSPDAEVEIPAPDIEPQR